MALQQAITTPDQTPHPLAYWRIEELTLRPIARVATLTVRGYYTSAVAGAVTANGGPDPVQVMVFQVPPAVYATYFSAAALAANGDDPFKGAYTWLAGQPFFNGATSV